MSLDPKNNRKSCPRIINFVDKFDLWFDRKSLFGKRSMYSMFVSWNNEYSFLFVCLNAIKWIFCFWLEEKIMKWWLHFMSYFIEQRIVIPLKSWNSHVHAIRFNFFFLKFSHLLCRMNLLSFFLFYKQLSIFY